MVDIFLQFAAREEITVLRNEPLSRHTSFKIGGPAKYFVEVLPCKISAVLNFAKENNIRFKVIGNGTNLLAPDDGYDGLIVKIKRAMPRLLDDTTIFASAGTLLSTLSDMALSCELAGLEFARGIPGSVGGAVFMNAGAYGGQIADVLQKTYYLDENITRSFDNEEHGFAYRTSVFKDRRDLIILGSEFSLTKGNGADIHAKMADFAARRREKQPIEYPSAGSTFKRPEGHFAGKLIEDCGLGGYTIGDAQVSEKHKGFVINIGNATCKDVLNLLEHIENTVYLSAGIHLEREVEML